jgi:hypothetical protein
MATAVRQRDNRPLERTAAAVYSFTFGVACGRSRSLCWSAQVGDDHGDKPA